MTRHHDHSEGKAVDPPSEKPRQLLVTVRLFPGVHGALIEELGKASRGLRAARAICLMTVGLTHERGQARLEERGSARDPHGAALVSTSRAAKAEVDSFVSQLLEQHGR